MAILERSAAFGATATIAAVGEHGYEWSDPDSVTTPGLPLAEVPPGTPTLLFQMSFTDPTEPFVWFTETPYVRRFSINRGRDSELDRSRAGQCSVLLDNRDGRYVASNTQGAHYPNLRPTRGVRLSAMVDTGVDGFTIGHSYVGGPDYIGAGDVVTFPLYTGYIEDWPFTWDISDNDATATLSATDGFLALSLADFTLRFTEEVFDETSGSRVLRVLGYAGWRYPYDPDATKIDDGTVAIVGAATGDISDKALNHIQAVTETDGGNMFIDTVGDVVFHDADHPVNIDPTEVYGDVDGEIGYQGITVIPGSDRIWNAITVTEAPNQHVATGVATSPTSIARHWRRDQEFSLLPADPIDGVVTVPLRRAQELRDKYAMPRQRITELRLRPTDTATWRRVLRHDIGDLVLVRRRPAAGDMIEQVSRIEGIAIDSASKFDWVVTWQLSEHQDPTVSLLTDNQRSFETDTTGWFAELNCTIDTFDGLAVDGDRSLIMDPSAYPASIISDPVDVIGGVAYRSVGATATFLAFVRFGVYTYFQHGFGGERARWELDWFTSDGTYISTSQGALSAVSTRGWAFPELEATAPATAAFVRLRLVIEGRWIEESSRVAVDALDFYAI